MNCFVALLFFLETVFFHLKKMPYSRANLSDTTLGLVCVPSAAGLGQLDSISRDGLWSPQPWSQSVGPTTSMTLRWSTAILQDCTVRRASNLLWLAWPNFGLHFFLPLGFTDYTLEEEKNYVPKAILTPPFLKKMQGIKQLVASG